MVIKSIPECLSLHHSMASNHPCMEWSEEVIAYLAAHWLAGAHTTPRGISIIQRRHCNRGYVQGYPLLPHVCKIKVKTNDQIMKETDQGNAQSENNDLEVQDLTKQVQGIVTEITSLTDKRDQKKSSLIKADFLPRYTLLHATSKDPSIVVRRIMWTSNSDSGTVTGLDGDLASNDSSACKVIKNQNVFVAQADHVTCRVECRGDSFQSMKHLAARRLPTESKITLALESVKGNLAQSLNVSVSDTTTWPQVRSLLINYYFNSAAPTETRGIYQITSDKKEETNAFNNRGGGKGHISKDLNKGSKGPQAVSLKKGSQRQGQDQVQQQGSMDYLVMKS